VSAGCGTGTSRRSRRALCAVALALPLTSGTAWADAAVGVSVSLSGFPDNARKHKAKVCQDGQFPWTSDCEWNGLSFKATIESEDGISSVAGFVGGVQKIVTCNPPLPAEPCDTPVTVTECTFTEDFAVSCGDQGVEREITFSGKSCLIYNYGFAKATLVLSCNTCDVATRKADTASNGTTAVPERASAQIARIQYVILNNDQVANDIDLALSGVPGGWSASAVPAQIHLASGASLELDVDVIVPGGTPEGATGDLLLSAAIPGVGGSGTSATATVIVVPPVPLPGLWALSALAGLLLGTGALGLRRRPPGR